MASDLSIWPGFSCIEVPVRIKASHGGWKCAHLLYDELADEIRLGLHNSQINQFPNIIEKISVHEAHVSERGGALREARKRTGWPWTPQSR